MQWSGDWLVPRGMNLELTTSGLGLRRWTMGRQMRSGTALALLVLIRALLLAGSARGQVLKLVERAPDPHGSPRPARDAMDVPLRTSLYLEI